MQKKDIICYVILIIMLFISFIINIILLTKRKDNILYGSDYKNIATNIIENNTTDDIRIDTHLKFILNNICVKNKFKVLSNKSIQYDPENNDNLNNLVDEIYKKEEPSSFEPDYFIDLENRIVIIEFDEGGNFHSDTDNKNYIKKWLNYNEMLKDNNINGKKIVIIRITYADNAYWFTKTTVKHTSTETKRTTSKKIEKVTIDNCDKLKKDARDYEFMTIINYVLMASTLTGCYYLYKMKANVAKKNKLVIVNNETIVENITKSCRELYNNENNTSINFEELEETINNNKIEVIPKTSKLKGSNKTIYNPNRNYYDLETYIHVIFNDPNRKEDFSFAIYSSDMGFPDYSYLSEQSERDYALRYRNNYCGKYSRFAKKYFNKMDVFEDENIVDEIKLLFEEDFNEDLKLFYSFEDKEPYRIYANLMVVSLILIRQGTHYDINTVEQETLNEHNNILITFKDFINNVKSYLVPEVLEMINTLNPEISY